MSNTENLQLQVVQDIQGFQSLQSEWDELVLETSGNMFLMHTWLSAWWKNYGDRCHLYTLVVRDGLEMIGALPLMFQRGLGGVRRLQFMGSGEVTPNHLGIVVRPAKQAEVTQIILEHLSSMRLKWDVLELNKLLADGDLPKLLKSYFEMHHMVNDLTIYTRCAYIDLPSTFEEYLKTRSHNKRRNLHKSKKKLINDYPSTKFAFVQTPDELSKVLTRLIELHQIRWTAKGYPGAFATQRFRQFHYEVSLLFLKRGELRLSYLEVDSKIIAVCYCYKVKDVMQGYLPSFDEQWANYSPGSVLKAYTIEQAIQQGAKEYDFLEGEESDKYSWATNFRENLMLRVYAASWRGMLNHFNALVLDSIKELGIKYVPVKIRRPLWQFLLRLSVVQATTSTENTEETP
ncbi:MAG TPA: GNAT family N-acetyltransferase [Anaerolineales bacterium]|nr:GNAT family N-acetyltransferase [Anaerolineales bacterium]HLO33519.1 GNAT family N-acetyltransferase [Anaerolineales bacterium]